jgi:hypothetical protein
MTYQLLVRPFGLPQRQARARTVPMLTRTCDWIGLLNGVAFSFGFGGEQADGRRDVAERDETTDAIARTARRKVTDRVGRRVDEREMTNRKRTHDGRERVDVASQAPSALSSVYIKLLLRVTSSLRRSRTESPDSKGEESAGSGTRKVGRESSGDVEDRALLVFALYVPMSLFL